MNIGKNRYTYAYTVPLENWTVRIDVEQRQGLADVEEMKVYGEAFLNFLTVDFLFSITDDSGKSLTEIPLLRSDREDVNNYVLDLLEAYKQMKQSPLTHKQLEKGLYLKLLYEKSKDCMLTLPEYTKFKKIFHAITRGDINTVLVTFKDYSPKRILKKTKVIGDKIENNTN